MSYSTIAFADNGPLDNTPVFTVPAGHYFVIGDNLDNSANSRMLSQIGYIPFENLVGRAAFIYFSVDRPNHAQPRVRFDRVGMALQ